MNRCLKHSRTATVLQKCLVVLNRCSQQKQLAQVHAFMIKTSLDLQPFPTSKLLASAMPFPAYARSIFDRFPDPNLFMWNTVLRSSASGSATRDSLSIFNSMRGQISAIDQFTFVCILKACAHVKAIDDGRSIHNIVLKTGFGSYLRVQNSIIRVYAVCQWIGSAQKMFVQMSERDLVSWNVLMDGFVRVGCNEEAFNLFNEMRSSEGVEICDRTILVLLRGCEDNCNNSSDDLSLARYAVVHGFCVKNSFHLQRIVMTAITDMYSSNGCLSAARRAFNEILDPDTAAWNCMIGGYVKNKRFEESLMLYHKMKLEGLKPNHVTMVILLRAITQMGSVSYGINIYQQIMDEGIELNAVLGTALIDMFGKCGSIDRAIEVFDVMLYKDSMAWSAMISCLAVHGRGIDALTLFKRMHDEHIRPNEVTFLSVLIACSHAGLVEQGKLYFDTMESEYGLIPRMEHYGCMIDMLGRAGLLDEAHELIKSMPMDLDASGWRSFLASCRVHGDVELGELAKNALLRLEPQHPSDKILLLGAYAAVDRWHDVWRLKDDASTGTTVSVKKEAGCSSIVAATHRESKSPPVL